MNEKNYNLTLRRVIDDAIPIALTLYSTNTSKVAGPYSEEMALELSYLLEKAYAGKVEPVNMNPYIDQDKKNVKVTPQSKMTVADIFPISSEKVKNFMT